MAKFKQQLEHCYTCSTYVFAEKSGMAPNFCIIHSFFKDGKTKMCPCSECLVKVMCTEDCDKLASYIFSQGKS